MEIDIIIDSLTECLLDKNTGQKYATEYLLAARTISKQKANHFIQEGWKFDWSKPQKNGYKIFELHLKGDNAIQGMIAIKHIYDQYYTHIDIVESAPSNVGSKGKYKGVGAHLFAIACKESWDAGNEGYVQFTAKTDLLQHYVNTLNAKPLDWHTLYIDSYGAAELIQKYFGKDT